MNWIIAKGLLIPFLGTALGSAMVIFMKRDLNTTVQKMLSGFAAGVMVAASVWSLLIPAMEMATSSYMARGINPKLSFIPAAAGFCFGMVFLLILDKLIPHMHLDESQEGLKSNLQKTTMMVLAVTLHNIPEGMAVGILYAGWASGSAEISQAGALTLALGIAIQNFPEGAIISMPLHSKGLSKKKSLPLWRPFRYCRTSRRIFNPSSGKQSSFNPSIFFKFCRRRHDFRCCGRTGS